jgi:hypothetical protein
MTGTFATSGLLILEIVMRRRIFPPVPAAPPGDVVLGTWDRGESGEVDVVEVFVAEGFVFEVLLCRSFVLGGAFCCWGCRWTWWDEAVGDEMSCGQRDGCSWIY